MSGDARRPPELRCVVYIEPHGSEKAIKHTQKRRTTPGLTSKEELFTIANVHNGAPTSNKLAWKASLVCHVQEEDTAERQVSSWPHCSFAAEGVDRRGTCNDDYLFTCIIFCMNIRCRQN